MGCLKINHAYTTGLKISWINKSLRYKKSENNYRSGNIFGFNGKENDNEVKKDANGNNIKGAQQDYGFRIYDTRLQRFLSVDPIAKNYPMLTPYQFASNRPIDGIDKDGLEWSSSGTTFNFFKSEVEIRRTIKIAVSNSSQIISDLKSIDLYKNAIKQTVERDFSQQGNGTFSNPNILTSVEFVEKGDFTIELSDAIPSYDKANNLKGYITGNTDNGIGQTQKNNLKVAVTLGGEERSIDDIARTASHELGHSGGLKHPFHGASETDIQGLAPVGPATYEFNLMNSFGGSRDPNKSDYNPTPSTSGNYVSPQQNQTIEKEINNDTKRN